MPSSTATDRDDCTVLVQRLSSVNACSAKNYRINDCAEAHLFPSQKIQVFHLFNGFYHFDIIKQDNRKYYVVSLRIGNYKKKIFQNLFFMSFRTSRYIVGQFFTMSNANIGLCSQMRPNFL